VGTKAELITSVQTVIGRDDKASTIETFLSRAQRFLAANYNLPGIFTSLSETLAASSQTIVIPSNNLRTSKMFYKDATSEEGGIIRPVSIDYFKKNYYYPAKGPANPERFAIDPPARRWRFSSYPSNDITIEIEVVSVPPAISDSQNSIIIEGDDAISFLTASYVLYSLGEDTRGKSNFGLAKIFAETLASAHESNLSFLDGRDD